MREVLDSMKKKTVLLSSLAAFVFVLTSANAQSTNKFQVNGVDASMTACLNGCLDGTAIVTVSSGQSNGQTTWFAYFDIYGHDSQGNLTVIGSSGQIPSSMVSGNGQTSLTLNLDTNAAGMALQYCVADQFLNYTCTPYAGGVMNVSWTPTKYYTSKGTVVDQQTSGSFRLQYQVSGSTSSALVQATVFGQQYADAGNSQIGTDHVGQISFTQP
jgi:hypothetical protein